MSHCREVLKEEDREGHLVCQWGAHLTRGRNTWQPFRGCSQTTTIMVVKALVLQQENPSALVEKQYVIFTWFPTSLHEGMLNNVSPFLICRNISSGICLDARIFQLIFHQFFSVILRTVYLEKEKIIHMCQMSTFMGPRNHSEEVSILLGKSHTQKTMFSFSLLYSQYNQYITEFQFHFIQSLLRKEINSRFVFKQKVAGFTIKSNL